MDLTSGRDTTEYRITLWSGIVGCVALLAGIGGGVTVVYLDSMPLAAVAIAALLGGAHVVATACRSYGGSRGAAKAAAHAPPARVMGGRI